MLDILYFLYFSKGEEDIPIGIPMTDTVFVVKDNEGQTVTKGKGLLYIGRLFFLSCTGSFWAVKLHWLYTFLLYTVIDQNIAFLVPYSCWATERNGNSISANVPLKTFRTTFVSAIFRQFGSCFGLFDIAG